MVDGLDRRYYCPRCGEVLLSDAGIDLSAGELPEAATTAPRAAVAPVELAAAPDLPDFKPVRPPQPEPSRITSLRWDAANWELNEKLRHVERLTSVGRRRFDAPPSSRSAPVPTSPAAHARAESYPSTYEPPAFDPPPAPFEPSPYTHPFHSPTAPYPADEPAPYAFPGHAPYEQNAGPLEILASLTSWTFLGLAVGAFSCGGFLVGWGAVAERPHLQSLGMPIVLGGMVALLVGLLPQSYLRSKEEERRARTIASAYGRSSAAGPHFRPSPERHPSHVARSQ